MCLSLYLLTDANLPEVKRDQASPYFHAAHVKKNETFLETLPGANAVLLGSYEGCGCGFISDDSDSARDQSACQASLARMSAYVASALKEGPVVLFAAWAGDERKEPTRTKVEIGDLPGYPWHETWDGPHLIELIADET